MSAFIGCINVKGNCDVNGNPNRGWAITNRGCVIDWIEEEYHGVQSMINAYPLSGMFLANVSTVARESPARFRRSAKGRQEDLRNYIVQLLPLPTSKRREERKKDMKAFMSDQRALWDFELYKLFRNNFGMYTKVDNATLLRIAQIPHEERRRSFDYPELGADLPEIDDSL
jgi:hypothetical protein